MVHPFSKLLNACMKGRSLQTQMRPLERASVYVSATMDCHIYFRLSVSEPPQQPLSGPKKVISTQTCASSNFKSKGNIDLQMLRQGWCAELGGDMMGCYKVSEFQMSKKGLPGPLGLFNLWAQWPVYRLVCSNTVQSGQQWLSVCAMGDKSYHQGLSTRLYPWNCCLFIH